MPGACSILSVFTDLRISAGSPAPSVPASSRQAPTWLETGELFDALGRQAGDLEAGGRKRRYQLGDGTTAAERNPQRGPHRNPDRLAVERVATCGVQHHPIGAEDAGIAEDSADIVVIGNTAGAPPAAPSRGIPARNSGKRTGGQVPPHGENAAMHGKADRSIEHRASRHIDRAGILHPGEQILDALDPVLEDQRFLQHETGRGPASASISALQHHPPLGDESGRRDRRDPCRASR